MTHLLIVHNSRLEGTGRGSSARPPLTSLFVLTICRLVAEFGFPAEVVDANFTFPVESIRRCR
jgi:hypothetical protein